MKLNKMAWKRILLTYLLIMSTPLFAELNLTGNMVTNGQATVDAKSSIYAAGLTAPPTMPGGAGLLPTVITLDAASQKVFTFSNVTGEVYCTYSYSVPASQADGHVGCIYKTETNGINNLSGIKYSKTMFLAGVFLDNAAVTAETYIPPNSTYTYVENNKMVDITAERNAFAPELRQVFFIGDGLDKKGNTQQFLAPKNATRLYLGFIDMNEAGEIGYYTDNEGSLTLDYAVYEAQLPETNLIPTEDGLAVHLSFDEDVNNMTGLGNNGMSLMSGQNFSYIDSLEGAGMALTMTPSLVTLNQAGAVAQYDTPTTWTISSWIKITSSQAEDYYLLYPYIFHSSQSCRDSAVMVKNNELGMSQCSDKSQFYGSGFDMTTLNEGWHHITAIGDQSKTQFYIDGQHVGTADSQADELVYVIGDYGLILDDFRVYYRALSQAEITTLATKPTFGKLTGISTRGYVSTTASENMFAGISVEGENETKQKVVVRAIGKGLTAQGVDTPLDPRVVVRTFPDSTLLDENDNWQSHSSIEEVTYLNQTPPDATDAAMINYFSNGLYTMQVSPNNLGGIGLVEVYDLSNNNDVRLKGISTRGPVHTDPAEYMYAGLLVQGKTKVIIRAQGKGLKASGVDSNLDAKIIVRKYPEGTEVASNDNWQTDPTAQELVYRNEHPKDVSDAAMIVELEEGLYTIEVSPGTGYYWGTSIGLIEVYDIR